MKFSSNRNRVRWIIIAASFVIVTLILWNTYSFFRYFKDEERVKVELWAEAQKSLNDPTTVDFSLPLFVISHNATIPIIQTNERDSIIATRNIDENIVKSVPGMNRMLERLKKENDPIIIEYSPGKFHYLYYGNSSLLNKLKYYPIALGLIIVLFAGVVYNFYRSTKMATQNKLWAGMAKETAHQIGTPLSSLLGWIEIMKASDIDSDMVSEIEKDVLRLQTIADRFSKIGSEPALEKADLVEQTRQTFDYLQSRVSPNINFVFNAPDKKLFYNINPALHSWTIENLVKNAVDAMKGRGKVTVTIHEDAKFMKILVSDTGRGIPKQKFKSVFEPGFTTKKRGWGLGLSLTKRIVEDYHKGKIKVLHSEMGKGTTMQISFRKI